MTHHIKAEVILQSINPTTKDRITTLLLQYPRVIHSELMTHRLLSPFPEFAINTASSRAVPVKKWIERLEKEYYKPERWLGNKKGMTAKTTEVDNPELMECFYEIAFKETIKIVSAMGENNLSKQIANRLLEPFQIIQCIVTATQWNNFFTLRDSLDADPLIQELASKIKTAMASCLSIEQNQHFPFLNNDELSLNTKDKIKISSARCARVSYLINPDDKPKTCEEDLSLADKLLESGHLSPFEHTALAFDKRIMVGSFVGWVSARKLLYQEDGGDIPDVPILTPHKVKQLLADQNPFFWDSINNKSKLTK